MKSNEDKKQQYTGLPDRVAAYLSELVARVRCRHKVRADVSEELAAHFTDALRECQSEQEKQKRAEQIVEEFGDIELLARLLRRAKKRCRPPWVRALVRTVQAIGTAVLLFVLYCVWFLTGRPSPSVDYLARLNAMSRPEIRAEDNAWIDYDEAIQLMVELTYEVNEFFRVQQARRELTGQLASVSAAEREVVTGWIQANGPAWEAFAAGAAKPYCYRPYHGDPNDEGQPWLMSVMLTHLSGLRQLSFVGIWKARFAAEAGQVETALDHCLSIARGARHWQTRPVLVEQLVGAGMSLLANREIRSILDAHKLSATQVERVQTELAAIYGDNYPAVDVSFERMALLDAIQNVFTDGGPGGGHLVPRELASLTDDLPLPELPAHSLFSAPVLVGLGMLHARRNETIEKANVLCDRLEARAAMTPFEREQSDLPDGDAMLFELSKVRYALLWTLLPAVDRASEIGFRGRVAHEATLTILALHRWRLEKGGYPDHLTDLVEAGYLAHVPADPFADGPLVYRVTEDGFILYSLGCNCEDDGGKLGYDRKGRPSIWHEEHADAVFWPLPERRD